MATERTGRPGRSSRVAVVAWLMTAALLLVSACSTGAALPADGHAQQRARLRMELALGYFQNGQTAVALEEVQQALAADPRHAPAHNLQGLILLRQGDRHAAERSFRRAVSLDSHDADARHNLGLLLCEQQEHEEAAEQFTLALAEPAYAAKARTHLAAGTCALQAGQASQAALHARAASGQPSAASLWLGLRAAHQLGDAASEADYAARLLQQFPDSAEMQRYQRKAWTD